MAKYPQDQFDDIPADLARVGAHRSPPKAGRGWVTFAWAALFTGIFVVAGIGGLTLFKNQGFLGNAPEPTSTISAAQTADPILDPTTIDPARAITITILNGTTTVDLQKKAGADLTAKMWPIGTLANSTNRSEKATFVYYNNPSDEDVARGVVLALGVGEIRESTAFQGAAITIVLGADYLAAPATSP